MTFGSILVVSPDTGIADTLNKALSDLGAITVLSRLRVAFDHIYDEIPNLLIVDIHGDEDAAGLLNTLKEDPLFAHLPVLVILGRGDTKPHWQDLPADDYIWREDLTDDILTKVELCLVRAERIVEVNPLTRLP
ncbi:MAG: hypothetical protein PHN75_00790 [Syntrophales bacterium]|nr:hypothetical protein [Syntrophales bacterium]